jgi:hypothetical protein
MFIKRQLKTRSTIANSRVKLAIVGIRGLPNNYGGFETLAEYIVKFLAKDFEITVYCSSVNLPNKLKEFYGSKLKYIPISSHGAAGIIYDSLALIDAIFRNDRVLILGFGGGLAIPFLKKFRSKIIVNFGGLDWKRSKWSPVSRKIIKICESLLVKHGGKIVSDNLEIQKYVKLEYGKESSLIPYGGDQAQNEPIYEGLSSIYPFLKLKYAFTVTRIQPDNNIEMILKAFVSEQKVPLVMVGNWTNSKYGEKLRKQYDNEKSLFLLDAIYDCRLLNVLRSNCCVYIHGHSAGGTNPSLVEAMNVGLPIFAFASTYNKCTTEQEALYFNTSKELQVLLQDYEPANKTSIGLKLKDIAEKSYRWNLVTDKYKKVILEN